MEYDREKLSEESISQILQLIEEKSYIKAREELLKYNEVDIAEILEDIMDVAGVDKTIILFRTLPKNISVEVFSHLDIEEQLKIINGITDKEAPLHH